MIYAPDEDTLFLLDNVEPKGRILEMGAGSGYISIELKNKGFEVLAVDIDNEAVKKIFDQGIRAVVSGLFSDVHGKFDTIIFNPPYLPGKIEDDITIFGGKNGQEVLEKFLEQVDVHLEKNGRIFMILSSFNDLNYLKDKFENFCFKLLKEKKFAFHSIYAYLIWRCTDELP